MKILLILLLAVFPYYLNKTKTIEDEFLEVVNENYDEYYLLNKETELGTLIIAKGKTSKTNSFSVFFLSETSKTVSLTVCKGKKEYKKSVKDYLVYYNVPLIDNTDYKIRLSSTSNVTYLEIDFNSITNELKGLGNDNFPYTSKLKNEYNKVKLITFIVLGIIIIEGGLLALILIKKARKKAEQLEKNKTTEYISTEYEVEDQNETN